MKLYLAVTGTVFVLIVAAHVWRAVVEPTVVRDPWFLVTTVLGVALATWSVVVYRRRSKHVD